MSSKDDKNIHTSPDIKEWFDNFTSTLQPEFPVDTNNDQYLEPFFQIEEKCASLDQPLIELEETTKQLQDCVKTMSEIAAQCRYNSNATQISSKSIPDLHEESTIFSGIYHSIHSFLKISSNWIFSFFSK